MIYRRKCRTCAVKHESKEKVWQIFSCKILCAAGRFLEIRDGYVSNGFANHIDGIQFTNAKPPLMRKSDGRYGHGFKSYNSTGYGVHSNTIFAGDDQSH